MWKFLFVFFIFSHTLLSIPAYGTQDSIAIDMQLKRAESLRTIDPEKTKELLKELSDKKTTMSSEQLIRYQLVEIHNKAILGELADGLAQAERLLKNPDINSDQQLRLYYLLANIHQLEGDNRKLFKYLLDGLSIYDKTSSPYEKMGFMLLASSAFSMVGDYDDGFSYANQAIEQAKLSNHPYSICWAYDGLAKVNFLKENYDVAYDLYSKILATCQDDEVLNSASRSVLAYVRIKQGLYQQAVEQLNESREVITHSSYKYLRASFYVYSAMAKYELGQFDSALADSNRALEEITQYKSGDLRSEFYMVRTMLFITLGKEKEALDALKHYSIALENKYENDKSIMISYMDVHDEVIRKTREVNELEQRNKLLELTEQAVRQHVVILLLGIVSLALACILLILVINRFRRDRLHYRKLSELDPLTGIYNRRTLLHHAEGLFSRAKMVGSPLCVSYIDLDNFKEINDLFGHTCGDEVLRQVTHSLSAVIRERDIIGRAGGEEFIIVLPGANLQEAKAVLDRCRQVITPVMTSSACIMVTASFGLAALTEHDDNIDVLLKRADVALYQAKTSGRDQVVIDHSH